MSPKMWCSERTGHVFFPSCEREKTPLFFMFLLETGGWEMTLPSPRLTSFLFLYRCGMVEQGVQNTHVDTHTAPVWLLLTEKYLHAAHSMSFLIYVGWFCCLIFNFKSLTVDTWFATVPVASGEQDIDGCAVTHGQSLYSSSVGGIQQHCGVPGLLPPLQDGSAAGVLP